MSRMADSWDGEVQESLLTQIMDRHYQEGEVSLNDRRPFPALERQPDLMIRDASGEVTRYAYLLQPGEVQKSLLEELSRETDEHLDLFVPYANKANVEQWVEELTLNAECVGYRLTCGLLQLLP